MGYFELVLEFSGTSWHTVDMPKRISKNPSDVNQAAYLMVHRSTGTEPAPVPRRASQSDVSRVMAAMGRKGGKIGGKRRMVTMTPEQRHDVAVRAARARWDTKG